jgi:A/G-specific adenine glycosylase
MNTDKKKQKSYPCSSVFIGGYNLLPVSTTSGAHGEKLLAWYRQGHRDLPWRNTDDPYRIWVSEIMLQQTRAQAVIPYYHRFLERFPTVAVLAAAAEEDVLALWSGLGYYSRARNLRAAAR